MKPKYTAKLFYDLLNNSPLVITNIITYLYNICLELYNYIIYKINVYYTIIRFSKLMCLSLLQDQLYIIYYIILID